MRLKPSRLVVTGLVILLFLAAPLPAFGDEGMFLPDSLSQLLAKKLKRRGLEIPLQEIYNPNGVSIKDAVVMVGGGTGEFVSPDGLLLTNHHVALTALAAASDPTKDYATDGFKADSRAEELWAQDYSITITQDLKDVTSQILSGVTESMSPGERTNAILKNTSEIENAGRNQPNGISVRVLPLNEGLSYYKFTYLTLNDVRIVYAPPRSIGYFGGDSDNFLWPRHCGDFAFMRAYVGADGKPAEHDPTNVPYKPRKFLPLSMDGVKEGDFLMVMGYPNFTRRYRESYSVAYNQDLALPFSIDIATKQTEALQAAANNDPALLIKLQSTIFNIANQKKNDEGSVFAMRRADLLGMKRAQEAALERWIESNPDRKRQYGEVLPCLNQAYEEINSTALSDLLVPELLVSSGLLRIAVEARDFAATKEKSAPVAAPTVEAARARVRSRALATLAERNVTAEREILTYLLRKASELPERQKIEVIEKRFAGLQPEARRRAEQDFAHLIVDSRKFATVESVGGLYALSSAQLRDLREPFIDFALELSALAAQQQNRPQFATIARCRRLLLAAMNAFQGRKTYPDANRTLRLTYGNIKGYMPGDAKIYRPFTYLSGVLEKDTGVEPFAVPEKLKQLYHARDFGPYAIAGGSNVPVDFLTDTDIIAGNSGSPVLNGRGQQVGIIFDGNYEGLGNDFFYSADQGRSMAVDMRYVLFVTDKFGGAGYLLKELSLLRSPRRVHH